MGKIIFWFVSFCIVLYANESNQVNQELQDKCLRCHMQEQIPNELIYRHYLMAYSTRESMKKAIIHYLKNPKKEHSIMPPQFFLKFPMKAALSLDDESLERNVLSFLDTFDVKKNLRLPQ